MRRRSLATCVVSRAALFASLLASLPLAARADVGLSASRPLAGIVNEVPTVNVPSVRAKAASASTAGAPATHSLAFAEFMVKFDKAGTYCPDAPPPCEESLHREKIFLENVALIEAHNAERERTGGGMKLGVTRFADLTKDEFSAHAGGGARGRRAASSDDAIARAADRSASGSLEAPRALSDADAGAGAAGAAPFRVPKLGAGEPSPPADDDAAAAGPDAGRVYDCERDVSPAVRNAAKARLASAKPHSKQFVDFVERFGKRALYCGPDPANFPCEESYRREIILLRNVRHIEAHNAARPKGGMRKVVTRFADLSADEFAANHATYAASPTTAKGGGSGASSGDPPGSEEEDPEDRGGAPRRSLERVEARIERRVNARRDAANAAAANAANAAAATNAAGGLAALGEAETDSDSDSGSGSEALPEGSSFPRVAASVLAEEWSTLAKRGPSKTLNPFATDADDEEDEEASSAASVGGSEAEAFVSDYVAARREADAAGGARPAEEEGEGEDEDEASLGRMDGLSDAEAALADEDDDLAEQAAREAAAVARAADADATAFSAGGGASSVSQLGNKKTIRPADVDLPDQFDWRSKMDIGPLYSQGACSGCWAYSTVQVIADSKLISTGHRPSPSPYYLLSCDSLDSGCNTGNMATAYAWIQVQPHGILGVEAFPTTSDTCAAALGDAKKTQSGVSIDGFCEIPPLRGEETAHALLRALAQQPVAVGMNVKPLQLYGGGLVQMADCPPASEDQINAINHAAVVVGWGVDEESEKPYFLVKNSYGQDWGENGYARVEMAFDGDSLYGACGFFSEQNYPLTDGRDCAEGSTRKWSEQRGEDVYLMPDNVVVLPNGGGILTPARIKVFGYDLTTILKTASFVCFALCVFFLVVELYYCFSGAEDGDASLPPTPASQRGADYGGTK